MRPQSSSIHFVTFKWFGQKFVPLTFEQQTDFNSNKQSVCKMQPYHGLKLDTRPSPHQPLQHHLLPRSSWEFCSKLVLSSLTFNDCDNDRAPCSGSCQGSGTTTRFSLKWKKWIDFELINGPSDLSFIVPDSGWKLLRCWTIEHGLILFYSTPSCKRICLHKWNALFMLSSFKRHKGCWGSPKYINKTKVLNVLRTEVWKPTMKWESGVHKSKMKSRWISEVPLSKTHTVRLGRCI